MAKIILSIFSSRVCRLRTNFRMESFLKRVRAGFEPTTSQSWPCYPSGLPSSFLYYRPHAPFKAFTSKEVFPHLRSLKHKTRKIGLKTSTSTSTASKVDEKAIAAFTFCCNQKKIPQREKKFKQKVATRWRSKILFSLRQRPKLGL